MITPLGANVPLAYYGAPVAADARTSPETLALYASDVWSGALGPLTPAIGTRLELARDGAPLLSPHLGLSLDAWSGAVLKAAIRRLEQRVTEPLWLEGNADLRAARVWHGVVGLEQTLPGATLLRLEGYGKRYSHLPVVAEGSRATL